MKQIIMMTTVVVLILGGASLAQAHGNTTRGQAGEMALHRLDKLITLNKVDAAFKTASNQLNVVLKPVDADAPSGTVFGGTVSQVAAVDGSRKAVKLFMDDDGKTLIHKPVDGGDALTPPVWPAKDSISLMQVAMHCLEGELIDGNRACADNTDLPAFNQDFLTLTLSQIKDAAGAPAGALAEILAEGGKSTLKIHLNLDGTLAKGQPIEIVPIP
jgi:hypothetical protein